MKQISVNNENLIFPIWQQIKQKIEFTFDFEPQNVNVRPHMNIVLWCSPQMELIIWWSLNRFEFNYIFFFLLKAIFHRLNYSVNTVIPRLFKIFLGLEVTNTLKQWFPTGVPRHTRVPWRGIRGAAKHWIYYHFSFFTTKGALNCHFSQGKGAAKFFSVLQGAVNQKRLKNTALKQCCPIR